MDIETHSRYRCSGPGYSISQLPNLFELWVAFGTGKSFRFIAAHEIAYTLGPDRCEALPMFHAFTGCDTVSCFGGRGKKLHGTLGPPMKTLL